MAADDRLSGYEPEGPEGPATEAKELLLSCLRFVARDKDGDPDPGAEPIPYSDIWDDRDPIGFVPPPSPSPWLGGWNQVWNTIASLDQADEPIHQLEEAVELLRAFISVEDHVALVKAIVAATRFVDEWDNDT